MWLELGRGIIIFVLILGAIIGSMIMMARGTKNHWFLGILDSSNPALELNLYCGMISLYSLFIYTAFATIIDNIPYDPVGLGRGIGLIFIGISLGAVGNGLQTKEEEDDLPEVIDYPFLKLQDLYSVLFSRLLNSRDRSVEMHLFLGGLAIILFILYEGYDLAYISKSFDAENYGAGVAYTFGGIAAASWGQGMQRKFENKRKRKHKPKSVKPVKKPETVKIDAVKSS